MINKENNKLIPAKEIPNNLKFTSLQLVTLLFKEFNNSALSTISRELTAHPENSLNILFSIP